jgi:hypothetical protein
VAELLKPTRGGFLRVIGCGEFVREFLLGQGPLSSPSIDPAIGAPQADIFFYYKRALMRATALDQATRAEEKQARREKRPISLDNIEKLAERHLSRMPYKAQGCRFHSFITYFSTLQRLNLLELTGKEERSSFQENHPPGPPRRYFHLTGASQAASDAAWSNPNLALYRGRWQNDARRKICK